MDPYSSPDTIPNDIPYNPFPHSLLSTRLSATKGFGMPLAVRMATRCSGFVLALPIRSAG